MPQTKRPTRSRLSNALTQLGISDLMAEVQRRREVLIEQLEAIGAQIAELGSLGGSAPPQRRGPGRPKGSASKARGRRGRRSGNEMSLAERLHTVLRGRTMSVAEMAEAAVKAGYKTKSKSFRTVVGLALLNNPKRFKRVSRGMYTAK